MLLDGFFMGLIVLCSYTFLCMSISLFYIRRCIECVKSSPYPELASELEMAKALTYLRQRDFAKAVETLKGFEKKDSKMAATASTNLSFLYFLVSNCICNNFAHIVYFNCIVTGRRSETSRKICRFSYEH